MEAEQKKKIKENGERGEKGRNIFKIILSFSISPCLFSLSP